LITQALELPLTLPTGSLATYINSVNQIPMLSAAEEQELALRYRHDDDLDAARQLVMSHLRFVVRVARGYSGYGLAQADLIQEGNIGLMKAVKRFDPAVGVRLVSFAVHWIRAEMHEFILRNWRIVKVATTKAQRKLFFNLRNAKKRLGWMSEKEVQDVARDLGVHPRTVVEMEERLNAYDTSYDHADDEDAAAPANYLQDRRFEPQALAEHDETHHDREDLLHTALATLDQRSRDIVTRRWLQEDKCTLHDLAREYAVSAERIRQLEQSAFKKLRSTLDVTALLPAPSQ